LKTDHLLHFIQNKSTLLINEQWTIRFSRWPPTIKAITDEGQEIMFREIIW